MTCLPATLREGEAVWLGGWCFVTAVDQPAGPSARGEELPPPTLERGGGAAGTMVRVGPLSTGGGRDRVPHTSRVSSELSGVSSELSGVNSELSLVSCVSGKHEILGGGGRHE